MEGGRKEGGAAVGSGVQELTLGSHFLSVK